jgi:hypothetical protein
MTTWGAYVLREKTMDRSSRASSPIDRVDRDY